MPAYRMGLLTLAMTVCATTAFAGEPAPRLNALQLLGQQNMNSIASSPRMGGPQGISVNELPAAAAHREAQQVDAIHAVRAGSTRPIPDIQLAHPSHVVGVPGSRPFVSNGPISRSPGTRRRVYRPNPQSHYPAISHFPVPSPHGDGRTTASQPAVAPASVGRSVNSASAAFFTTSSVSRSQFPGVGGQL